MAARTSAGLLLYRRRGEGIEVLLAHMGGPFWARKDEAAWSIVKGEYTEDEDAYAAARREFLEETGLEPPGGTAVPLGDIRQSGGKLVVAWALEGDLDPQAIVPGTFLLEWPPRSGREQEFPEIDRVDWFDPATARTKIVRAQTVFLDRLAGEVCAGGTT
jgi:predicted NUDIX family NTP pyrophosphohydrolase